MQLEDFTQKFAECFHQTDVSQISQSTQFKKLDEWGSMLALIIIAMVDAEYGKTLSSEDLKEADTVEQLFERLSNNCK